MILVAWEVDRLSEPLVQQLLGRSRSFVRLTSFRLAHYEWKWVAERKLWRWSLLACLSIYPVSSNRGKRLTLYTNTWKTNFLHNLCFLRRADCCVQKLVMAAIPSCAKYKKRFPIRDTLFIGSILHHNPVQQIDTCRADTLHGSQAVAIWSAFVIPPIDIEHILFYNYCAIGIVHILQNNIK